MKFHQLVEFDDDFAIDRVNEALAKDWELIHVGTKVNGLLDNGQAGYSTTYIFGLNKEQYEEYKEYMKSPNFIDDFSPNSDD
ncbi:hypothetical protein [Staphylococcus borealis]|uniref:hypothetical protein n=1 Tax=Staphylococcus borealis TaxID=2742203 RepID=UPI002DBD1114|nr:hypothetical protein [Staphylococcus borealis]MEB7365399.1 hypothetical protein [Staphylococcus borealis]